MAKRHKKKRQKAYHGEDAATPTPSGPVVHRYTAVERSKLGEWWQDRKRRVKPLAIVGGIALVIAWLLFELVRALF